MKKLILIIAAAILSLSASAQFRWGVTAGMDVTTLSFKQNLFKVDQSIGYTAGVMGELMFPGIGFGIDFGLNYAQRGATLHLGQKTIWESQGYDKPRSYLHYLDIPLHLRFKWTRMNGFEEILAPFVFGGPSFNFLVGHSDIPALKYAAGEVGITAGLGVELHRRWQVSASYTWGMTYAVKTALLTDMSAQNRSWDVKVTYLF